MATRQINSTAKYVKIGDQFYERDKATINDAATADKTYYQIEGGTTLSDLQGKYLDYAVYDEQGNEVSNQAEGEGQATSNRNVGNQPSQVYDAETTRIRTPDGRMHTVAVGSEAEAKYQNQIAQGFNRNSGESITDFTKRINQSTGGGGYSTSVVGTSAATRIKELQKLFGLGQAPTMPDLFTSKDQRTLDTARRERSAIDDEMSSILNERLAIDEELQKYAINAGEGTTEAGRIGAVSEAQRNANERLMVLNRRELVLETKLQTRLNVISELSRAQQTEYEFAVQAYESKFSKALQLYDIFQAEEQKAYDRQMDAYNIQRQEQDDLRRFAMASADTLIQGIKEFPEAFNNPPRDSLRKWQEIELQAGLPEGYIQNISMAANSMGEQWDYKTTIGSKETGYNALFVSSSGETKVLQVVPGFGGSSSSGASGGSSGGGGSVAITPEDRRILTGAGFSTSDISQIVSDVTAHGIDAVLDGVSGSQKTAIQKVFNVTPKVTLAQITSSVTQKLAQEGLESAYTTEELEKLAAKYGFASIWKSRETEVQNFLNSSKAKEVYADLLYQQYKDAGQAE